MILFTNDPDAAELAWLEWAMHLSLTALDTESLDAAGFGEVTTGIGRTTGPECAFHSRLRCTCARFTAIA